MISDFFYDITNSFTILSLIDILIMTFIIYSLIKLIKGTQAQQVAKGILIIVAITQITDWVGLVAINFVFENIMTVGFIALLIMFQPELRKALETLGNTNVDSFKGIFTDMSMGSNNEEFIEQIISSILILSRNRTGALIILQRKTPLDDVIDTGVKLDSLYSSELLSNIFTPKSPLHDGAIILDTTTQRIKAASCLLPLTQNRDLSTTIGTRHRAGIGISESSDCISLIVSEETGVISYAYGGKLSRFLDENSLRRILVQTLIPEKPSQSKNIFKESKNGK